MVSKLIIISQIVELCVQIVTLRRPEKAKDGSDFYYFFTCIKHKMEPGISKIKDELLKDSHKYWKKESFEKYFQEKKIELDPDSLLELYISLIEGDGLSFKMSVGAKIDEVASTNEKFFELIRKILGDNEYDLSNGPITFPLVRIGENNPDLGWEIANIMVEKGGALLRYSSFPLGGVGRNNFQKVFEKIKELFGSTDLWKRVCALRTLRVSFSDKELKNESEIFDIIQKASEDKDVNVKAESLECSKDFYSKNRELFKKLIKKLVEEDFKLAHTFAYGAWIHPLEPPEDNIEFLRICSKHENFHVFEKVCYALTKLTKQYPKEIMEILRNRIEQDGYHFSHMGYLLEELGKENFEAAMDFVGDYLINKDHPRFSFHLKNVVNDLAPDKSKERLIPYIEKWIADPKKYDKALQVLLEVLSSEFKTPEEKFVDVSFSFLSDLASSKTIDIDSITKSQDGKVLQCAGIIKMLQYYVEDLDYDTIKKNLECLPNIKNLFGESWFAQMETENNNTHPILRVLAQPFKTPEKVAKAINDIGTAPPEHKSWMIFRSRTMLSTMMYLENIEKNLHNFRNRGFSMIHCRDGFKNEEQFQATLSELNFGFPFLAGFTVEPEPDVGGKVLDYKITIDSIPIFVEVISPEMVKQMELLTGVMTGIKNRVKSKIYDEYKEQLIQLSSQNHPVVVAVDVGNSEIDYESVIDYLYGSPKMTMHMDAKTHDVVKTVYHRDADTMHDLEPQMDMISAVICFKTILDDSQLIYRNFGEVIRNPYARVPLDDKIIQKIQDAFFS